MTAVSAVAMRTTTLDTRSGKSDQPPRVALPWYATISTAKKAVSVLPIRNACTGRIGRAAIPTSITMVRVMGKFSCGVECRTRS
jgi:hypothetical protein